MRTSGFFLSQDAPWRRLRHRILGGTWVGFLTIENKLNTAETIDRFFHYLVKMF